MPTSVMWMLHLMNFIFPLILIPISIPLVKNKIKPNHLYGFRTRKTLSNEAIWYQANAYAGRLLLRASLITLIGLIFWTPFAWLLPGWPFVGVSWALTFAPLAFAVVQSFRYLKTL